MLPQTALASALRQCCQTCGPGARTGLTVRLIQPAVCFLFSFNMMSVILWLFCFFPFNAHFLHFSFRLYFSNLSIFFLFYSSLFCSFISFSPSFHFPFVPFFVSFLYSCISSVPSLAFRCFSPPPFILLSFVCPFPFLLLFS